MLVTGLFVVTIVHIVIRVCSIKCMRVLAISVRAASHSSRGSSSRGIKRTISVLMTSRCALSGVSVKLPAATARRHTVVLLVAVALIPWRSLWWRNSSCPCRRRRSRRPCVRVRIRCRRAGLGSGSRVRLRAAAHGRRTGIRRLARRELGVLEHDGVAVQRGRMQRLATAAACARVAESRRRCRRVRRPGATTSMEVASGATWRGHDVGRRRCDGGSELVVR